MTLLNNLLVPLDGSQLAEAALPFAQAVATRTGARLTLIRAARSRSSRLIELGPVEQLQSIDDAEGYLHRMAEGLGARGFSVETGVPFGGDPAQWIIEECGYRKADLIVMATHDRVGLDHWLHGSVAEAVVHASAIPVMLVRAVAPQALAERFGGHEPVLLVPLDGSELADAALPLAGGLAQTIGARIVLIGVIPKPGQLVGVEGAAVPYTGNDFEQVDAEARAYLKTSAAQFESPMRVECVLRYGEPAAEIAAAADEFAAAAVVMGTHGRTGLVRSMLGSVAGGVLHRCTAPVILVHSRLARGAEQPVGQVAAFAGD
jgi:nucleotide-binding universal stress UspA family protein